MRQHNHMLTPQLGKENPPAAPSTLENLDTLLYTDSSSSLATHQRQQVYGAIQRVNPASMH